MLASVTGTSSPSSRSASVDVVLEDEQPPSTSIKLTIPARNVFLIVPTGTSLGISYFSYRSFMLKLEFPMETLFGLEGDQSHAKLVVIPVPWDATTSYGKGTAKAPSRVLTASQQQDLADAEIVDIPKPGIRMLPVPGEIAELSRTALKPPAEMNRSSARVNQWVYDQSRALLEDDKIVAVLGGEHSVPYGALKALGEREENFGILHIDAHHDLRVAYQGYTHSHASIFYNVCKDIPSMTKLVQVGIRDFSTEEAAFASASGGRIQVFYDRYLEDLREGGTPWSKTAPRIVSELPSRVWISFDIDGLDPTLCPGTGTPVPGGLSFAQARILLREIVRSGRRIVGFDLSEVGPEEWDCNVGMRMLFQLCGWTFVSQGLADLHPMKG